MVKASQGGTEFLKTQGEKIEGGIQILTYRQGGTNPSRHYAIFNITNQF